jgi:type III secretory pathway component EscT
MNRFVPSLNVFFFSLPVKSILTFILLTLCLVTLVEVFRKDMLFSPVLKDFLKTVFQ